MDEYGWWGNDNEPPENLKTKRQLAELGLAPLKACGVIKTQKYDLMLYDIDNPECYRAKRSCTPKQLETLAANRLKAQIKRDYQEWLSSRDYTIERDRVYAVEWARLQLAQSDWVILDTETTGLYDAEIVEIAITDNGGVAMMNTLVRPSIPIPAEVTEIHGITDEMVAQAPTFPDIYLQIKEILKGKRVLIYNAEFDIKILNYCCELHDLPILKLKARSECIMEWHAQWAGDWSYYHESYTWHPLCGGHRALGDCLAALERIKKIAADSDKIEAPVPIPE